ncbi:MAG: FAD-binding oxidoreductase [Acidimicrobiales bacterium]
MTQLGADRLDVLRAEVDGAVCVPGDAGFAEACNIWNGAITRRPSVVVRCLGPGDVAAALRHARGEGLEVSVRGGGHGFSGAALCEGGLTIDLSLMRSVEIDPEGKRATCGGGVTWAELDGAAQQHGLAVPGGFISHTGIAGLTLGGGMGWLTRHAGLSCENLVGAEVVVPDGRILRASESEHPDLFWAIRGGGGNFGVVTSFEFRLTAVGPFVQLGLFFFPPDQGKEMFRFARDYVETLPSDCGTFIGALNAPPEPFVPEEYQLQPGYALVVVGFGDEAGHAQMIAPIRASLSPAFELVTPMPYVALQQMFDPSAPWGILGYEKAVYLDDMTDGAIDVLTTHFPKKASPLSFVPIFSLGGAYRSAAPDAVAFGGSRATRWVVNLAAVAPTAELLEADTAWVRAFWSDLVRHASGVGSYVNFMSEYDEDRVRASYGAERYARLAAIKALYDPDNVLHLNANIKPTG